MDFLNAKNTILSLLETTDIRINGDKPWDIQVHDNQFYARVIKDGVLGLGESYVDGWWDCEHLDQLFDKLISENLEANLKKNIFLLLKLISFKFLNLQTKRLSKKVAQAHYDLGNDLFAAMLDTRMNYTCGYWQHANDLDTAQRNKLELVCQKLQLKPGMHVLDIGCGFGSFAKYACENYDVKVTGVTISKEQAKYAMESCQNLPVEILLEDYRDIKGKYDAIVSLGMFEHVGTLNYKTYMRIVHDALKDDQGLFLLHTIGDNITTTTANEWITKYIFPNGVLPSISAIGKSCEALLIMEDWHNFGVDYDKTLLAWHANFNQHWDALKAHYGDKFQRMWNYYLLSSAGAFRARHIQLWQIVFSKHGLREGYRRPAL